MASKICQKIGRTIAWAVMTSIWWTTNKRGKKYKAVAVAQSLADQPLLPTLLLLCPLHYTSAILDS